jgi:hypothetical protein
MFDQAWMNAFGADLHGGTSAPTTVPDHGGGLLDGGINIGVNDPIVVAGNGVDNHIDGSVSAIGTQNVGDQGAGGGINIGVNVPIVVAGNGVDNHIDGSVSAIGTQNVGDTSYHLDNPYIGGINIGVNVPVAVVGNGVGNDIGDVTAGADQGIGHHGLF